MSNPISDGRGTGNLAEVDDHGRLFVRANIVSHMSHHATYHKNAYIKTFETTLPDSNETICLLLQNDNQTVDLEIYGIHVSTNANMEVNVCVNNTYTSGGNEIEVVNTNLSSNALPTATVVEGGTSGDMIVDSSNEKEIDGGFIGAYTPVIFSHEGALVITPSKSLCFKATGAVGNKIRITLTFALHGTGARL